MGESERWSEPGGPLPNGLLPGAGHAMRALDTERWMMAEERTTELIACIQPNQLSEERRNAVANYVQQLIMNCFPCQVCTFGSVPLKTYLPDGDIDLTAFSHDQNLKDTWANQVRDMLQNEEKNENAEFHVKEVQYIQAEVKIVKCLVENIVVDISFNQVGGLCTLCFLDEVDNLINQNHLFKRSVILVKAWCYYESRILGAHHGLISTYALETLVLYIFHVFNNSFHGPLEVLYRFLEFFGKFDWDNFCVSLWGPVPINSLPDVTADPPRKDSGELLLSKLFLDACSSVYAVFPGGQEHNGQPFLSKHFNVIDPLRVNNNLGRSVSKGNFFRIRSAFAFGAKRLARLLDCPKENLILEVNKFFRNTWERHGSGHRPDASGADLMQKRVLTPDVLYDSGNPNIVHVKNVTENSVVHEKKDNNIHGGVSSQPGRISAKRIPMTNELSVASHIHSLKSKNLKSLRVTEQMEREKVSEQICLNDGIQKDLKADHFLKDTQGRFLFARTHSSPELTDGCVDLLSQSRSHRQAEGTYAHNTKMDVNNNGKNHGSEILRSSINHSTVKDTSFVKNACSEEISYTPEAHVLNQEKQDIMTMMSSASLQSFDGQFHVPFNLNSAHLPFPIAPSFLASMGYPQRSLSGFVPTNVPLINPSFTHVQFPHSLASAQFTQSSNGFGVNSPSEAVSERSSENFDSVVINSEDTDNDFWQEQDVCSSTGCDPESGNLDMVKSGDKPPALISGSRYVPLSAPRASSSATAMRIQQKHRREKHGSLQQSNGDFTMQDDRGSDLYAEERSTSSRSSSAAHSNSLRSRTSSESSWDGSSLKTSTSTKEISGKKIVSVDLATSHLKGQILSDHVLNQTEDDDLKYAELSNKGSEMADRNPGSETITSLQVPSHHISGSEATQTNGADSMFPLAPMLIDPGLRQRINDNSGLVAFYPTGPPIPFLTMLPVYDCPSKKNTFDASGGHCGGDETLINSESQNLIPVDLDNSEDFPSSSLKENTAAMASGMRTQDILNSDFASHWQNLQFGRFCQDPQPHGPLLYPSPVMVPPTYLHGRFPYANAGRPLPTTANIFSQLMTSYGPRMVPVSPLQSVSSRPLNMYQHYTDDIPRYRSGTGTYLPNPVSGRERHSTGTRRGSYNNDRNDSYGDKEVNWNGSSKSRSGRIHSRNQNDRLNSRTDHMAPVENQSDHSWNTYRHETTPSYQCQNGQLNSNSNIDGPHHVAYSMFPLTATNPVGVSNGPSGPPVVVLYPFEHNAAYGFHGEPLEFGSLGHVDLPGVDEQSHLNEGSISRAFEAHRRNGNSIHQSSPDQPSSPRHRRKI